MNRDSGPPRADRRDFLKPQSKCGGGIRRGATPAPGACVFRRRADGPGATLSGQNGGRQVGCLRRSRFHQSLHTAEGFSTRSST